MSIVTINNVRLFLTVHTRIVRTPDVHGSADVNLPPLLDLPVSFLTLDGGSQIVVDPKHRWHERGLPYAMKRLWSDG